MVPAPFPLMSWASAVTWPPQLPGRFQLPLLLPFVNFERLENHFANCVRESICCTDCYSQMAGFLKYCLQRRLPHPVPNVAPNFQRGRCWEEAPERGVSRERLAAAAPRLSPGLQGRCRRVRAAVPRSALASPPPRRARPGLRSPGGSPRRAGSPPQLEPSRDHQSSLLQRMGS